MSVRPPSRAFRPTRRADDHTALQTLSVDRDVMARATNPAAVRLLWEVCQIPDFRKVMPDIHATLLRRIFLFLSDDAGGGGGRLPNDWVAGQIGGLDNIAGDIDTLTQRIAHVRTWTYISHRADWLVDAESWRDRARRIEDRLSDALHDRLTQRFVDRHAPIMVKQRQGDGALACFIDKTGDVVVESVSVGVMQGLRFIPDSTTKTEQGRVLISAARRTIDDDIRRRVNTIAAAPDDAFSIGAEFTLCWGDATIADMRAGDTALVPHITVSRSEYLDGPRREKVRARLSVWLAQHLERRLGPLFTAKSAEISGALRGVVYQLAEVLGSAPREDIKINFDRLSVADRKVLAKLGVRTGLHSVYFKGLLNASAIRTRAILAAIYHNAPSVPRRPKPARLAIWEMMGFRVLGGRALRVDVLEKFAAIVRKSARAGPVAITPEMLSLVACDAQGMISVMGDLGYRVKETPEGTRFQPRNRRQSNRDKARKK
ncbi:MAG: disulfide oxidoreductase, partial [Alphaproteobacteria bacterium]